MMHDASVLRGWDRRCWTLWAQWVLANAVGWAGALALANYAVHPLIGFAWQAGLLAIPQWAFLHRRLPRAGWWVPASAVSGFVAVQVVWQFVAILQTTGTLLETTVAKVFIWMVVGVAQWVILRGQCPRAGWWILDSAVGAALSATFSWGLSSVWDLPRQTTPVAVGLAYSVVHGAATIVPYAALTGFTLVTLLQGRPQVAPSAVTMDRPGQSRGPVVTERWHWGPRVKWVLACVVGWTIAGFVSVFTVPITLNLMQRSASPVDILLGWAINPLSLATPVMLVQWVVIRRWIPRSNWWAPAGIAGWMLSAPIVSATVMFVMQPTPKAESETLSGWQSVLAYAVSLAVVGAAQSLLLQGYDRSAAWWVLDNALAGALVGLSMMPVVLAMSPGARVGGSPANLQDAALSIGASAVDGLICGTITGYTLVTMLRNRRQVSLRPG
jgi:hypothetical protein